MPSGRVAQNGQPRSQCNCRFPQIRAAVEVQDSNGADGAERFIPARALRQKLQADQRLGITLPQSGIVLGSAMFSARRCRAGNSAGSSRLARLDNLAEEQTVYP